MNKSANEIINELEGRIARLERQAYTSFINEALDIMFLDLGGHRDRVYSSSEATETIDVHLELLTEEGEHFGRNLRSKRDYDNFAKDVYGTPDALAKAVDRYLRGKGSLGNMRGKRAARLEKQSHLSVRDSSKKVIKALDDLDRAMDQMDDALHSMPSFTSNDRYYQQIAERWYQLRKNLNTVKGEVDYIKGAY